MTPLYLYRIGLVQATVEGVGTSVVGLVLEMLIHTRLVSFINCYISFRPFAVIFEEARSWFPRKNGSPFIKLFIKTIFPGSDGDYDEEEEDDYRSEDEDDYEKEEG